MHKIRRLFLSLLLFPLALISCGNSRVFGRYAFQMGSDRGSHFGVFVDLDKDDYIEAGVKKGQHFKFGARLSEDMIPTLPEKDPEDPAGYLEKVFIYMMALLLNVEQDSSAGLEGYYNITNKYYEDKGYKLDMNIVFDIGETDDLLQKFLISYLKGNTMSIVLPVSVQDLQYQLCWYGMYVDFDMDTFEVDIIEFYDGNHNYLLPMPGPQGEDRIGSHPTETDIADMNAKYGPNAPVEQCRIFNKENWFKDFNTLTVELLKN